MTPQTKQLYEAAKAVSRLRFISHPFVVLREALSAFKQSQHETSKIKNNLDKLAETVLREYVKFEDVNGNKPVSLLPLTIVDMMVEFIDRVNEQPEAIAAFEQSQQGENKTATVNEVEKYICETYGEKWMDKYATWAIQDIIDAMVGFASQQTASKDKEIAPLLAEIDRLKQQRHDWACHLLKVRDALAENDQNEAYHWLYQIASPNFDKDSDEVWKEIEVLATPPTTKVKTM